MIPYSENQCVYYLLWVNYNLAYVISGVMKPIFNTRLYYMPRESFSHFIS